MNTDASTELHMLLQGLKAGAESVTKIRATYDKEVAFDFDPFSHFFQPFLNENKITAMLAFFLDPRKPHGQGDAFLRVFLDRLLPKESARAGRDTRVRPQDWGGDS